MTETVLQSDDALVACDQVTLTDDNDDDNTLVARDQVTLTDDSDDEDVMTANVCKDQVCNSRLGRNESDNASGLQLC